MKTRIHIHRENISGVINKRHFMVCIPRDADEIIAIKVSAVKLKHNGEENHFEAGLFRMTRDGIVLYETQVRDESFDAEFLQRISSPCSMENGLAYQAGGHCDFQSVLFSGQPRALFCKYDGNKAPTSLDYVLALYFIYTKKVKQ